MKLKYILLTLGVSSLLLAGCGKGNTPTTESNSAVPVPISTSSNSAVEETAENGTSQNEMPPEKPDSNPPSNMEQPSGPPSDMPQDISLISDEEVKEIVLNEAGVTEDEIEFYTQELDFDNGINEYDIDFYVGSTEYSYTLNAETGEILEYSSETEESLND